MKYNSRAGKIFDVFNVIFMLVIIFIMAYPLYFVFVASISGSRELSLHTGLLFKPVGEINFDAYKMVLDNRLIGSGFLNTLFLLTVGLCTNLIMTAIGAFFLSLKRGMMLQSPIAIMVIITMYFSGGMVPHYLNIRQLGLYNSLWALVLPGAISTYNMIILKSGFESVPDSLVESAYLDGASYPQILFKVMLPLSKASMAVQALYYGVSHWNSWFNASIYLRDDKKFPLQLVVRNILEYATNAMESVAANEMAQVAELMKYALIVVSTVPILALYPFLQKYFVKGVMIGAVKG